MTAVEQYQVAEQTKEFLAKWGLKKKFVARTCGIPEGVFSKFINNKVALSGKQLERVTSYTSDYVRRNG